MPPHHPSSLFLCTSSDDAPAGSSARCALVARLVEAGEHLSPRLTRALGRVGLTESGFAVLASLGLEECRLSAPLLRDYAAGLSASCRCAVGARLEGASLLRRRRSGEGPAAYAVTAVGKARLRLAAEQLVAVAREVTSAVDDETALALARDLERVVRASRD